MWNVLKRIIKWILNQWSGMDVIVFESAPVYADNSRAVFDEMIRREYQKTYKFYWMVNNPAAQLPEIPYVKYLDGNPKTFLGKLWLKVILYGAQAVISCNDPICQRRKGQYAICLMHGAPLKNVSNHFALPEELEDILVFSSYLKPYEEKNSNSDIRKMRVLGFPRNDILLNSTTDVHELFPDVEFTKFIYWMPTYRQHRNQKHNFSTISVPILYNEQIAQQVNACAAEHGVLVVMKPHFAQDLTRIRAMNLSHLRFIDDEFLRRHQTINYALLGKADAMLTDYSSVYYDYLLTDRPIGLCWDDYADFEAKEGFIVDMDTVLAGGEKLYMAEDLCGFIRRISAGEDACRAERRAVTELIHDYRDDRSSERVVDHIASKLNRTR